MGLAAAGVPHRAGGVDAAMNSSKGATRQIPRRNLKVVKT